MAAVDVAEMAFAASIGRISKDQSAITGIPMMQNRGRIGSRRVPDMSFSVRLPFIPSKDMSDTRHSSRLVAIARQRLAGRAPAALQPLLDL